MPTREDLAKRDALIVRMICKRVPREQIAVRAGLSIGRIGQIWTESGASMPAPEPEEQDGLSELAAEYGLADEDAKVEDTVTVRTKRGRKKAKKKTKKTMKVKSFLVIDGHPDRTGWTEEMRDASRDAFKVAMAGGYTREEANRDGCIAAAEVAKVECFDVKAKSLAEAYEETFGA